MFGVRHPDQTHISVYFPTGGETGTGVPGSKLFTEDGMNRPQLGSRRRET